jgi:hypothetical protein
LVRNTIATYKSCATTALVLSTGSKETLAEKEGTSTEDRGSRKDKMELEKDFQNGCDGCGTQGKTK